MKHKFTTINSSKISSDKYTRMYNILGWVFAGCMLLILLLRFILGSTFSLQGRVILYCALTLVLLILFIARMITDKVIDWSTVLLIAIMLALTLIDVSDAGGWSAVFSPAAF